jgi:CopG family transcriptional regulator/antitoxin EndoAI
MRQRVNITLAEETIRMLDGVAGKGERSRLIDEAVRHFVKARRRETLRTQLKEGARKRAERDLRLAEDWFLLEEESWRPDAK